jgi:hypothetical protein
MKQRLHIVMRDVDDGDVDAFEIDVDCPINSPEELEGACLPYVKALANLTARKVIRQAAEAKARAKMPKGETVQ